MIRCPSLLDRLFPALALTLLLAASPRLVAQTLDDGFDPRVAGGEVRAMTAGPNGSLFIAGSFSSVGGLARGKVALIENDGEQRPILMPDVQNGRVNAAVTDANGRFLIGGSFTSINGLTRTRLARIDVVGNLAAALPAPSDTVHALALDPATGKVYIGGAFAGVSGMGFSRVARLNANGTVDSSFNPPLFTGEVLALAVQPDGRLLIGGTVQLDGSFGARGLYRLLPDGSLDPDFSNAGAVGGGDAVRAIAVQPDGRILIGGDFSGGLRRYFADGTRDFDYGAPNFNDTVHHIALQPDGRVIVGGDFTNVSLRNRIVRLLPGGSVDGDFGGLLNPSSTVRAAHVQDDGSIVVAGAFVNFNGTISRPRIARLTPRGVVERSLGTGGGLSTNSLRNDMGWSVAFDADDTVLVGGDFGTAIQTGQSNWHLSRLREDGNLVGSFSPIFPAAWGTRRIEVHPDRSIRLSSGGDWTDVNGVQVPAGDAWMNPDGSVLANGPSVEGLPYASRLLTFTPIGDPDDRRFLLERTLPGGGIDTSFVPTEIRLDPDLFDAYSASNSEDGPNLAARLDHRQRILLYGKIGWVDGVRRAQLARLYPDGGLDQRFDARIERQADMNGHPSIRVWGTKGVGSAPGRVFALGAIRRQIDGEERAFSGLLVFDDQGEILNDTVRPADQSVFYAPKLTTLLPRADGKHYVFQHGEIGLIDENGADVPGFGPSPFVTAEFEICDTPGSPDPCEFSYTEFRPSLIEDALIQPDGRLLLAGRMWLDETQGSLFNRLSVPGAVEQEVSWDPVSQQVRWRLGGSAPAVNWPPRVQVAPLCCSDAFFEEPVGGGEMRRDGSDWVLDGFEGLAGTFYLRIEAWSRSKQRAFSTFYSPIHSFIGPDLPPVQSDLALRFDAPQAAANVGDTVLYDLFAFNFGPDDTDAVAQVPIPTGFEYLSHTESDGSWDPQTGEWTLQRLGSAPATLSLAMRVRGEGEHRATATIVGNEFDPDPGNNVAEQAFDISLIESDLGLVLVNDNPEAVPGSSLFFSVALRNDGPESADNAVVQLPVPSGYQLGQLFPPTQGSYSPVTGQWQVGRLPSGEAAALDFEATVRPSGEYTVSGSARSDSLDPDDSNNVATSALNGFADLELAVLSFPSEVRVGELVEVRLRALNRGPFPITDAAVRLTFPPELQIQPDGQVQIGGNGLSGLWSPPTLIPQGPEAGAELLLVFLATQAGTGTITADADHSRHELDPADNLVDFAIDVIDPRAELSIVELSADPQGAANGEPVTFRMTVTNNGPDTATGTWARLPLPDGWTSAGHVAPPGTTWDAATGAWNIGTLAAVGDSSSGFPDTLELQVTGLVNAGGGQEVTAELGSDARDTDPGDNTATLVYRPGGPQSDLAISVSVDEPAPDVGERVTFTLTVDNLGPAAADNLSVQLELGDGLSYVGHSAPPPGGYLPPLENWTLGDLSAPGGGADSVSMTLTVEVLAEFEPRLQGQIVMQQFDPDRSNNAFDVTLGEIEPESDLALVLSATPATAPVGETVTLSVEVANLGPDAAEGAEVLLELPPGLSYVSHEAPPGTGFLFASGSSTGSWTIGALAGPGGAGGNSRLLEVLVEVQPIGPYQAQATVGADTADPQPANDADSVTITPIPVSAEADLAAALAADADPVEIGETVTLTVTASNVGPDTASGVAVAVALPNGLQYVSHSAPAGTAWSPTSGTWTVGALASGGSEALQIVVRVQPSGFFEVGATISGAVDDPEPGNDVASLSVTPLPPAEAIFFDGFEPGTPVFP
ncbi:DUF11 domain-containing protein [Wenzhouxiangella sp. XN79A]|uniref:DUF11 domain-containing protein n=1 Tax=Wenzhouxiangella sp. XN79A TaxID=2724193 RepID=UPI00144AE32B|nr:DUF11 domain-containing protein [Wenzhouxiangella sp. XN79A]NKI36108.1 DUF11 domain-containing protein [Wenzhouxiangella sp. XN79A]